MNFFFLLSLIFAQNANETENNSTTSSVSTNTTNSTLSGTTGGNGTVTATLLGSSAQLQASLWLTVFHVFQ